MKSSKFGPKNLREKILYKRLRFIETYITVRAYLAAQSAFNPLQLGRQTVKQEERQARELVKQSLV